MTQCAVRRLRVAAASEPAARRFVTTLEDALRCATLPGDDRRVVVVRCLALGRIAHDAGTQRLGLLIEQRIARGEIAWADAAEPPDPHADAIGFAGALEARVHLARRLVRGAPCEAWYWPLAVTEYRREMAPREALGRMAAALAAWPEARVALPEWTRQVVRAGGATALCDAIDADVGRALLRAAGIEPHAPSSTSAAVPSRQTRAVGGAPARVARAHPRATASSGAPAWPAWLRVALSRAEPVQVDASARASIARSTHSRRDERGVIDVAAAPGSASRREDKASTRPPSRPGRPASGPPASVAQVEPSPRPETPSRPAPTSTTSPDAYLLTTHCGGLLFLLPAMARAGLVRGASLDEDRDAALRVLLAALRRVRAAPDDAAWGLVEALSPRREPDAEAAAHRDLAAARRWLHRHARLGLVTLVRRRALLTLTATHIDVRFPLAGADLRVRRAGLDIDPGWLPWFGRVIAFQFVGRQP